MDQNPAGRVVHRGGLDFQQLVVHDDIDKEWLPATYTLAGGFGLDCRFLIVQRVSITPYSSLHLRADLPTGAGSTSLRFTWRIGMRAGVVF